MIKKEEVNLDLVTRFLFCLNCYNNEIVINNVVDLFDKIDTILLLPDFFQLKNHRDYLANKYVDFFVKGGEKKCYQEEKKCATRRRKKMLPGGEKNEIN